jgi:hypothetical protein
MIGKVYPPWDLSRDRALVSGPTYTAQKIQAVLKLIRGEWFLDLNLGVPWYEEILVRGPNLDAIRGLIRDRITAVTGVARVLSVTLTPDYLHRHILISFEAQHDSGATMASTVEAGI